MNSEEPGRPNFVLVVTDQHCFHHLRCLGNHGPHTPNIDSLLDWGTAIDGMYTATPICMPNRQSLLTMQMPSLHGGHSNGIPLALDAKTFVHALRAAGYETALIGKAHLQPISNALPVLKHPSGTGPARQSDKSDNDARYLFELTGSGTDEAAKSFYGFDFLRLASRHGTVAGGDHALWLQDQGIDLNLAASRTEESSLHPQVFCPSLSAEFCATSYIAEQATEFLCNRQRDDTDSPFFLMVSFPDPHHPWNPPKPYYDLYDPADVTLPASFFDSPRNQNHALRQMAETLGEKRRRNAAPFVADEHVAREILAKTYGMVRFVDDAVGKVLETLKRLDCFDDTVVVFCSDHGDYMGDHGIFLKGVLHSDSLTKVPFIWSDPRESLCHGLNRFLASYVDIGASILDRAGMAQLDGCHGRSFLAAIEQQAAFRDSVLIEQQQFTPIMGYSLGTRFRTLVTERFRISISTEFDDGELYDRIDDPNEYRNLWFEPVHLSDRAMMLGKLAQEMAMMNECGRWPIRQA